MGLFRHINEHDTSNRTDDGRHVDQVMGDSTGYADYKRQYELAEDKCKFNAEFFSKDKS